MILMLNDGLDKPPSRLAELANRALLLCHVGEYKFEFDNSGVGEMVLLLSGSGIRWRLLFGGRNSSEASICALEGTLVLGA